MPLKILWNFCSLLARDLEEKTVGQCLGLTTCAIEEFVEFLEVHVVLTSVSVINSQSNTRIELIWVCCACL